MKFKLRKKTREGLFGYLFISIWLIGFGIFTLYPTIYSLFLSFQKVIITATAGIETTSVGLLNFKNAFLLDIKFTDYLLGFLKDLVMMVPIIIVFSLIISLLLNADIKFKGFFRTIFFLPVVILSGPVIQELINQKAMQIPGIKNYALVSYIRYSLDSKIADLIMLLMDNIILVLWYTGVQVLIFLAALQKMDGAIYEAARIDGASSWESFWKLTLPTLKPMIMINIIYTVVTLATFELNNVSKHISNNMFDVKTGFGYASALSWIYFILVALILAIVAGVFSYKSKRKHVRW